MERLLSICVKTTSEVYALFKCQLSKAKTQKNLIKYITSRLKKTTHVSKKLHCLYEYRFLEGEHYGILSRSRAVRKTSLLYSHFSQLLCDSRLRKTRESWHTYTATENEADNNSES